MSKFRDLPLKDILRILRPTFNSMEIRCLTLKKGEEYHNIAATIFFGYEKPSAVKSGLDVWRRQVRSDLLEKEGLRLFVEVCPGEDLDHLIEDLKAGFVSVEGGTVRVSLQPKTSATLDVSVYTHDPTRAPTGFRYVATHVDLDEPIMNRLPASISPSRLGLGNIRDLGPTFLDADILGTTSELMVFVPIYLQVLWPPTLEGRKVMWKVYGHRDLLLRTRFWGLRTLHDPRGPVVERLELSPISPKEEFGVTDLALQFEVLQTNNSITLLMIHEDLDEIASHSIGVSQYLQVPEQPLATLLRSFVAWQRIREFLSSPRSQPRLFEPAVHWIFTLLGWRGFQLSLDKRGGAEILAEELGGQTKLSVDMVLVSPQNKLVVFSLTSSLKDVAVKAQSIKNTANRLSEVLGSPVSFAVVVSDEVDVLRPTLRTVPLIGIAELNELWQQVEAGYIDRGNTILAQLLSG